MRWEWKCAGLLNWLTALGLLWSWGGGLLLAAPPITFQQGPDSLTIELSGRPVARYVFRDPDVSRPFFDKVCTPSGIEVTRPNPPREGQDPTDHV